VQNLPLFVFPQEQTQSSGFFVPHSVQNLPELLLPQAHCQMVLPCGAGTETGTEFIEAIVESIFSV
jgi:hypothetical protein